VTARPAPMRRSLTDAVDQVVRKEQFLADHPETSILVDLDASPYERWRGHLPGCPEVTSHDLGRLLDRLDDLVVARDVHIAGRTGRLPASSVVGRAKQIPSSGERSPDGSLISAWIVRPTAAPLASPVT
jgi:hypothetical protein